MLYTATHLWLGGMLSGKEESGREGGNDACNRDALHVPLWALMDSTHTG
jgi:hypothetical protein